VTGIFKKKSALGKQRKAFVRTTEITLLDILVNSEMTSNRRKFELNCWILSKYNTVTSRQDNNKEQAHTRNKRDERA
jgi:hypothetical protein